MNRLPADYVDIIADAMGHDDWCAGTAGVCGYENPVCGLWNRIRPVAGVVAMLLETVEREKRMRGRDLFTNSEADAGAWELAHMDEHDYEKPALSDLVDDDELDEDGGEAA